MPRTPAIPDKPLLALDALNKRLEEMTRATERAMQLAEERQAVSERRAEVIVRLVSLVEEACNLLDAVGKVSAAAADMNRRALETIHMTGKKP